MLQPLLDICICTCRRPEQLRRTLMSLSRMNLPDAVGLSVTVVDNDSSQGASRTVEDLQATFPFPIRYVVESRPGIPLARNRCLDEAKAKGVDYLVFIDDDEWVDSGWLVNLYSYAQKVGGNSVVSGPVISCLPVSSPEYYQVFFCRKKGTTGELMPYCATNNVLIPSFLYSEMGLRFDERNPYAGGTDVMFFTEARSRGVEIRRCVEAVVYEDVPEHRATLTWLSKRKYSVGITLARQKLYAGRNRSQLMGSAVTQFVVASLTLLVGLPFRRLRTRSWLRACRSAGMACGVLGAESQFYRRAHT
ncbi:hypothetical protein Maes01_01725 [Microbulbifer aestuariivivens]|uniref:Glycosyltransferase 2-like domain-containing protein n=1 Tax=Microbulbifer aestuariivivens TaxID=1908308 RepID=A0ABP9WSU7_9GAMM